MCPDSSHDAIHAPTLKTAQRRSFLLVPVYAVPNMQSGPLKLPGRSSADLSVYFAGMKLCGSGIKGAVVAGNSKDARHPGDDGAGLVPQLAPVACTENASSEPANSSGKRKRKIV